MVRNDYMTDPAEDARRMRQNLAAAVIIIFLLVFGGWLIDRLMRSAKVQACLEAGHRNCVPLEIDRVGPR